MFLVTFLSLVAVLTALLNAAVILAIVNTKKLHLPANYLICSLAVTDFLVSILVMPLSILVVATNRWLLGCVACETWLRVDMTCCTCSILHLCAIALDRHWAITKALEYVSRRTPRRRHGHRCLDRVCPDLSTALVLAAQQHRQQQLHQLHNLTRQRWLHRLFHTGGVLHPHGAHPRLLLPNLRHRSHLLPPAGQRRQPVK
ncbi:hypothetical protein DPEC_G00317010, partial [Dallia pectoralis]